jgi:hypothetical protein
MTRPISPVRLRLVTKDEAAGCDDRPDLYAAFAESLQMEDEPARMTRIDIAVCLAVALFLGFAVAVQF